MLTYPIDPGGITANGSSRLLRSFQDRSLLGSGIRWYRCAQPPANRFDPSGIFRTIEAKIVEAKKSFTPLGEGPWRRRGESSFDCMDTIQSPLSCFLLVKVFAQKLR
jgi:hypothetical protein